MPEKNILIADDDQEILDILKEIIQREGYKVFLASNGKEAVEAIKINPIDLAILDIKMPVMDGIEALEEIKKIDQGIEVLIITGYADLETLTQAISDHGAFDYILKPFKRVHILNGIQNALLKRDFASQKKPREEEPEERILQLEKEFHERTHQLRESQIKYRNIVENSNDAIVVIQDGKLKFANTKMVALTGYPQEELMTMSFLETVHPTPGIFNAEPNSDELQQAIYETISAGKTYTGEWLNKRKDGSTFYCQFKISPLFDESDNIIGYMGSQSDITERKQAEEVLKESEERYKALFERSLDAVYLNDFEGNFIDANRAALDLLGYKVKEISSLNFVDLLSEDQLPKAIDLTAKIMETGSHKELLEFNLRKKNGELVWVEIKASLIYKDGKPYAIQGIARDITERKQAEEKEKEHHKNIQLLFNTAMKFVEFPADKNIYNLIGEQVLLPYF